MNETRFIVAGSLIDGSGADVRKNIFIAVKEGIITEIGSANSLPLHDKSTVEDFSHCIILPPLVDCSVHLSRSPSIKKMTSSVDQTDMVKRHINYCHTHGVLGVVENDNITNLIESSKEETTQGAIIDIRTSGNVKQYTRDNTSHTFLEGGFIKIHYSGNIEDEKTPTPLHTHEELSHIMQQRGKIKIVVVANGTQQVSEALASGCDAIEQGFGMGEENLKIMAEKKVLWIPSILRAKNALDGASTSGDICCRFSQRYVAPGKPVPGAEELWKKILSEQLSQLQFARKTGVTTTMGTGAGSVGILHGESLVEEMKLFIKAGYSLVETIQCASENGASFFNMERLGRLKVGKRATFLLTRGSVQQLPRKLAYLEGIYIDGKPSTLYSK